MKLGGGSETPEEKSIKGASETGLVMGADFFIAPCLACDCDLFFSYLSYLEKRTGDYQTR